MKCQVFFPLRWNMSPIDYVCEPSQNETIEENALWHYNKSREHDGLISLSEIPKGTVFKRID